MLLFVENIALICHSRHSSNISMSRVPIAVVLAAAAILRHSVDNRNLQSDTFEEDDR